MSDAPLPEALIEQLREAVTLLPSGLAKRCGDIAGAVDTKHGPFCGLSDEQYAEVVLAAAILERDESGHRVVWSAEEVAGLQAALDAAHHAVAEHSDDATRFRDERDEWKTCAENLIASEPYARIAALEAEVEPLIEATAALLDALTAAYDPGRDFLYSDVLATLVEYRAAARAALARVRGPEPAEGCPTCGDWAQSWWHPGPDCPDPFHDRGPEERVSE